MLRLWGELASDTDVRDLDAWAFRTITKTIGVCPSFLPSRITSAAEGVVETVQRLALFSAMRGAKRRVASIVASSITASFGGAALSYTVAVVVETKEGEGPTVRIVGGF